MKHNSLFTMSEVNIFEKINNLAQYLKEEDLDDWIVPQLITYYTSKINSLAKRAYGYGATPGTVANLAFIERAKAELRAGTNTFLFKSEHWRTGRDLNTYLLTCLNRLSDKIRWDSDNIKKINVPICPACKQFNQREFLVYEDKMLRCQVCTSEVQRVSDEISAFKKKENKSKTDLYTILSLESKLQLRKLFSLHSRKGYRCKDCDRFIPESLNGPYGISCPYNDCDFFGKVEKLEFMAHPVGLSQRDMFSLQTPINNEEGKTNNDFQSKLTAEIINPDIQLEIHENFELEYKTLSQVMDEQIKAVKRTNASGTLMQKLLMYEAYQKMLNQYPEEMVSYLVHRKQSSDFPIQSRIFQEYVRLMQEAIPFDIQRGNETYTVLSLTDPNIQLFSGVSEFEATVCDDGSIPNNTIESYTGGLKFKNYGPCFIGLLIDVFNRNTKESLKNKVRNYTFVQINMTPDVMPGTPVLVKHFRIPSHYEIGSMVYLQRIRRKLVDSVYYRLTGQKRIPGVDYDKET